MSTTTRRRSRGGGSCPKCIEDVSSKASSIVDLTPWRRRGAPVFALVWLLLAAAPAPAQTSVQPAEPPPIAIDARPADATAILRFFNRPIVEFRARVLGRSPADRVTTAVKALDDVAAAGLTGPIGLRHFNGAVLITVDSRGVIALTPPDVDELAGETLDQVAAQASERLGQALGEAAEAHAPGRLLRSALLTLVAVVVACAVIVALRFGYRFVAGRLVSAAEQTATKSGLVDLDLLRRSRLLDL